MGALVASPGLKAQSIRTITFDGEALHRLYSELRADERHDLKGVLVMTCGQLGSEEYFNGGGPDVLHDIRSAGKSITALLTGVSIDRGLIRTVQQPFVDLLRVTGHRDKAAITLEHLLTMRSGLAANDEDAASPGNENNLDLSPAWLDFALSVPIQEPAGKTYRYCSLNAFLAGAVVEKSSGIHLDNFAREHIFSTLRIDRFEWRRGPDGYTAGQGNLRITLRAMGSLGQLVLDKGRSSDKQLISRSWIDRSTASKVAISHADPYADAYGYMWYTRTHQVGTKRIRVHFASGNGGNKIYVIPELETVVAIASAAYGRGYGQRRSQEILLRILGSVRG